MKRSICKFTCEPKNTTLSDEKFNNEVFRNSFNSMEKTNEDKNGEQVEEKKTEIFDHPSEILHHKYLPISYFKNSKDTVLNFRIQLEFYHRCPLHKITLLSLNYVILKDVEVVSEFIFFKNMNESYSFQNINFRKANDEKLIDVCLDNSHKIKYDAKKTVLDLRETIAAIDEITIHKVGLYYKEKELLDNNVILKSIVINETSFIMYRRKFSNEVFRNNSNLLEDNTHSGERNKEKTEVEKARGGDDPNKSFNEKLHLFPHECLPLKYFKKSRDMVLNFRIQLAFYYRCSLHKIALLSLNYIVLEDTEVVYEFIFFNNILESYVFPGLSPIRADDEKLVDVFIGHPHSKYKIRYDIKRTVLDLKATISAITKVIISKVGLYYKGKELLDNNVTLEVFGFDAASYIIYYEHMRGGGGVSIIFNGIHNYLEIWGYDDLLYKIEEKYYLKPDEYMLIHHDIPICSKTWKDNLTLRLKITSSSVNVTVVNLCFEKGRDFVDFIWKDLTLLKNHSSGGSLKNDKKLKEMIQNLIIVNQQLLGIIQMKQSSAKNYVCNSCCITT